MAKKKINPDEVDKVFNEVLMTGKQQHNGKDKEVDRQEEGKIVSIDKLPRSWVHFNRCFEIVRDPKIAKICIVAAKQKDGKWEAYAGYPDVTDLRITVPEIDDNWTVLLWNCDYIRDRNQVLMLGEKLPKSIALQMFPDWDKDQYKE